jgi:hypothetical protein
MFSVVVELTPVLRDFVMFFNDIKMLRPAGIFYLLGVEHVLGSEHDALGHEQQQLFPGVIEKQEPV